MTVTEFESYLQKGLGRAILLLRQEPDKEPFRQAVWDHAIHDSLYDKQCDAPRGHYIVDLISCFDDSEELLKELFRVYSEGADSNDRLYYVVNLAELTKEGVDGAKECLIALYEAIYKKLLNEPKPEPDENGVFIDYLLGDYNLAADRVRTLGVLAYERLLSDAVALLNTGGRYDMDVFADFFGRGNEEQISTEQAFALLRNENSEVEKVYTDYCEHQAMRAQRQKKAIEDLPPYPTNWREAIDYSIASKRGPLIPIKPILWKGLSAEEADEVARQVEEETDPLRRRTLMHQLISYGEEILSNYPRDPSPLVKEIEDKEYVSFPITDNYKRVLHLLRRLVSKIRHPAVREYALRAFPKYLKNPESIVLNASLGAWITNYQSQDEDLLVELITSISDENIIHGVCIDVLNWEEAPAHLLRYLYEKVPCPTCRGNIAYCLINKTALDGLMRDELPYDCESRTRKLIDTKSCEKSVSSIELYAEELHFLSETDGERGQDHCLHGKVTMRVNGHLFADEKECCVTASALRFLRSLSSDHKTGEEEFLFPCCGNMLIPSEDGKTVTIIGCPNGEDLEILTHRQGNQSMIKSENIRQFVSFDEYRAAVLAYAKQVLRFLQNSPERVFKDDYEKAGYEAFLTEFNDLMEKHKL